MRTDGDAITLAGPRVHARIALEKLGELTGLFAAVTGRQIELRIEIEQPTPAEPQASDPDQPDEPASDPISHPLVDEVARRFNARVTHIERRDRE